MCGGRGESEIAESLRLVHDVGLILQRLKAILQAFSFVPISCRKIPCKIVERLSMVRVYLDHFSPLCYRFVPVTGVKQLLS